ncbi:MAG: ABC-F family ATP-binding cassette domain-containing protein [Syntrophomonadaceae bacterium]|jgi:ATP-binding cassette subfamily F protein 3|nr:ABC-F family ATP-binding cassette domain-containing protein [Syntrophomonadaceae bacterium]
MIALQARNINKFYGDNHILKSAALLINEKERVGLVGANGTGKTTLLNCISGQLEFDSGEIIKGASLSLAYLEQMLTLPKDLSAWEMVMSSYAHLIALRGQIKELEQRISQTEDSQLTPLMDRYALLMDEYERNNAYACENTARRILVGLGFKEDDFHRPLSSFSGGQKTRINLGRLLAQAPDLLLLDEPTNHLDVESVEWLEGFLKDYPGTIVIVSHDRWFLDRVVTRIIELKNGQLKSYPGNFTAFLKAKVLDEEAEKRAYEKQQEYIKETEEYIRRFKAGIKSKQARGRETRLQRMEKLEGPQETASITSWNFSLEQESGQDVLSLREISKAFGDNSLFRGINLDLYRGEKVALIGPNGSGKTTLLKIITGQEQADQGTVKLGSRVKVAYFAQQYEGLEDSHTVLEEITLSFDISLGQARNLLGRMLFRGDEVFKKVADLSGGEKGRLAMLKNILSGANFLILDEPTNHLDIESRQIVEDMLGDYSGTLLLVSHDRYLIDRVAQRVLAIEPDGLQNYAGNYSYYLEKRKEVQDRAEASAGKSKISRQQEIRLKQKERERKKKMLANRLEKLEERIQQLEVSKDETEELLVSPGIYSDQEKSRYCLEEYEKIKGELNQAYEEWERLLEEVHHSQEETGG